MAEYMARDLAKKRQMDVQFFSAGVQAYPGDLMARYTKEVLEERGIEAGGFRSRKMTSYLLDEIDLIVPMTKSLEREFLVFDPSVASKLYLFWQRGGNEVPDPFGGSKEDYQYTGKVLEQNIERLLDDIGG